MQDIDRIVLDFSPIFHFHPDEGVFCCFPSSAEDTYSEFGLDWNMFTKDMSPKILDPNTSCYYEVWDDSEFIQIRYWLWYKFNRFPGAPFGLGNHLGDWEHLEVRLYKGSIGAPVNIWLYSNHLVSRLSSEPQGWTLPGFEAEPPTLDGSHVHVWVALGSHANYPSPKSKPYCHSRIFCDKIDNGGPTLKTKLGLKPLNQTNFFSYTGRWGSKKAPRGPTNAYNNRSCNAPNIHPIKYDI
ncbi:MAG: hypothetical protein ACXABF_02425 [Candidatus Thorarchaeota archaeon]